MSGIPSQQTIRSFARDHSICVIIPVYNNAATIGTVIEQALAYCDDVYVVDDGSTDGTGEIVKSFDTRIKLSTHSRNRGKGAALSTGFKAARADGMATAVTMDADGQHSAEDLPAFFEQAAKHPDDIIIGARAFDKVRINGKSNFANRFSNFWFTAHTGIKLGDTQTGYRAYPLKKKLSRLPGTSKYEAELSLLTNAAWSGVGIREIPIDVYYPDPSERISHFRPVRDFTRISILNTVQTGLASIYGWPRTGIRKLWRLLADRDCHLFTHRSGRRREAAYTLGRLTRSSYGGAFFTFYCMGVIIPFSYLYLSLCNKSDKSTLRFHKMLRYATKYILFRLPGAKFRFQNPKNISFERPAMVICNHQSHLDIIALMSVSERFVFLTNDRVWHSRLYGPIIRHAQFLSTSTGLDSMLEKLKTLTDKGYSIVVFPEGTRNPEGKIGRFKQGAFHIARELGLDIVEFVIHGACDFMSKRDIIFRRNPITLRCIDRIFHDETNDKSETMAKTASAFRKEISARYSELADEMRTFDYYKALLRYKYAWRGRSVVSEAYKSIKRLKAIARQNSGRIDIGYAYGDDRPITILNGGIGVEAIALALLYPDRKIEVYEADSRKYAILKDTISPSNLSVLNQDQNLLYLPREERHSSHYLVIVREDSDTSLYASLSPRHLDIRPT